MATTRFGDEALGDGIFGPSGLTARYPPASVLGGFPLGL